MDRLLEEIATYVDEASFSEESYDAAGLSLADALGCAILSLSYPACTKLLGPIVEGTAVPGGVKVPGVKDPLDPVTAAFNLGAMIRWLDFNDTWLAREWGHPSDNLGAILSVAAFYNLTMHDVLHSLIIAYEIQGVLALSLSCNQIGLDHVFFVKVASSAVACKLMDGTPSQIADALSQSLIDGAPLRTYRHAPNVGSRKSWAAGDATARGVYLAHLIMRGEMGYPNCLLAPKWGLQETLFKEQKLELVRPLKSYVIDHILFKVRHPAEFHAQTAVEAALQLHPHVKDRLETIDKILLWTHDSAIKIICKEGKLQNPADRDHCMQYMVAIALIFGDLDADHYEDKAAEDPRIDSMRNKIVIEEEKRFSEEYHHQDKRSIANALQILFKDGTKTEKVVIEYPLGHKKRRNEALPHLKEKLRSNLGNDKLAELLMDRSTYEKMKVRNFLDLF